MRATFRYALGCVNRLAPMPRLKARERAEEALKGELRVEAALVDRAFELLDDCARHLKSPPRETTIFRMGALIVAKAQHLALALYSLGLDGLAQEGGAVLRPLLEIIDLIRYLSDDPTRCEKILESGLPKAGAIAKISDSQFKPLREDLNEHASHFGLTERSVRHVFAGGQFRRSPEYHEQTLRGNLLTLLALMLVLLTETIRCYSVSGGSDSVIRGLAARHERLKLDAKPLLVLPKREERIG